MIVLSVMTNKKGQIRKQELKALVYLKKKKNVIKKKKMEKLYVNLVTKIVNNVKDQRIKIVLNVYLNKYK